MVAQLGRGPLGTVPSADHSWRWVAANFNPLCSTCGGANDEYMQTLTVDAAGEYAYAFRFTLDGIDYRYCDLDGDDFPAYSTLDQGVLTVTAP
jgi:hypothetical protein